MSMQLRRTDTRVHIGDALYIRRVHHDPGTSEWYAVATNTHDEEWLQPCPPPIADVLEEMFSDAVPAGGLVL